MITVEHEQRIARPVEEVFEFVADPRNDPEWCPPVREIRQVSGKYPKLGAEYEMVVKPGPIETKGTFEITAFSPPERVAYEGENGILRFDYGYRFISDDEETIVTMTSNLEPKWLWKLLTPIIRSDSEEVAVEEFENLRRLLEGNTAS